MIQEGGLFPHATVAQNIGLVPKLEGWGEDRITERAYGILDAVGLRREYMPRVIHGNFPAAKNRGSGSPGFGRGSSRLLLDEPFAALDPVTRFEMQQHFAHLTQSLGKTALFVTHDFARHLCWGRRIALLKEGRLEGSRPRR